MSDIYLEEFLEHYGVKGMQWGVRRKTRKAHFAEVKSINKQNLAKEKEARKDPTFKREVELTRKGQGIKGTKLRPQTAKNSELFTNRILGNFTNSKGEKVSVDFANAVLHEIYQKKEFKRKVKAGASLASTLAIPVAFKKIQGR